MTATALVDRAARPAEAAPASTLACTIWIDVEDLFEYAAQNPRPSGIQRVEYELGRALFALGGPGGRVRFVRHDTRRQSFRTVSWRAVECLFQELSARVYDAAPAPTDGLAAPRGAKKLIYRLPLPIRHKLIALMVHQRAACRLLLPLLRAVVTEALAPLHRGRAALPENDPDLAEFERCVAFGDVLAVLGSPWFHPDYAGLMARVQQARGMRLMVLIYDIIPLRRPEWCDRYLVRMFTAWIRDTLPLCDIIMTISHASATDILAYAAQTALPLRCVPQPIPIGSGFRGWEDAATPRALPPSRSYVLLVSTIEARKNHVLLLHVWRRLLEDLPPERVPFLVFAGRVGWLVADLMQQLENAAYLDGHIVLVDAPTDAELERLYAGCLFTLFPSFYEGWGLPVTESLAFGRPCVISNATSLPEAGGRLARYFDPQNLADAYRVIREVIEAPDELARWEARIAEEFTPIAWAQSAHAIVDACTLAR